MPGSVPINRVTQITDDHCGPAVLQMLLAAIGVNATQDEITVAAGAQDSIKDTGVTIDQLGRATKIIAPQTQFWYKYYASLDDVRYLLERGFPVGVEWQGLFYDTEEEEAAHRDEDSDFGHYSIISHLDDELDQLIIVDPYKDFVDRNRIVDFEFFNRRWWDTNDIKDPQTNMVRTVKDTKLLFFVAPVGTYFPREYGFKAFSVVSE